MDKEELEKYVEMWVDPEKKSGLSIGYKTLFEFLDQAPDPMIKDFPEIAKVYPEMRSRLKRKRYEL